MSGGGVPHWILTCGTEKLRAYASGTSQAGNQVSSATRQHARDELARRARKDDARKEVWDKIVAYGATDALVFAGRHGHKNDANDVIRLLNSLDLSNYFKPSPPAMTATEQQAKAFEQLGAFGTTAWRRRHVAGDFYKTVTDYITNPPVFTITKEEADRLLSGHWHNTKETPNMEPKTATNAAPETPVLTVTQRPLVQMLSNAMYYEKIAKEGLDNARETYAKKKAERMLIEADLKKIGYKPPVVAKPSKAKKA